MHSSRMFQAAGFVLLLIALPGTYLAGSSIFQNLWVLNPDGSIGPLPSRNVEVGNTTLNGTGPSIPLAAANFASVAAWGDSLTAGNEDGTGTTYPGVLAGLTGKSVLNGGVGGDTSTQIATRMLADSPRWPFFTIVWSGRNNYAAQSQILTDVASMVAVLPTPERVLVLSILNGETGGIGSLQYTQIINDNLALSGAYPNNYLDVRAFLVSKFNAGNALDVFDHMQDVPPSTLRVTASGTLGTAIPDTTSCTFTYTNSSAIAGQIFDVLTIGTEYILITAISGSGSGPYSVTGCSRGYAGSTAASHLISAPLTDTQPVHLNAAGYVFVAQYVLSWLAAHDPSFSGTNYTAFTPPVQTNTNQLNLVSANGSLTNSVFLSGDGTAFEFAASVVAASDGGMNIGYSATQLRPNLGFFRSAIQIGAVATSALPSCASATLGRRAEVNDATLAIPGSALAGGGTFTIAVQCIFNSSGAVYSWIID